jgi:hypothetical protein
MNKKITHEEIKQRLILGEACTIHLRIFSLLICSLKILILK